VSEDEIKTRLKVYQATAIFSVLFALVGFSYNVWRMEVTEHNSNVRSAAFELLLQLAELEQLVYAAHYDKDPQRGNPRDGWVKVGLIADLSHSCGDSARDAASDLRSTWSANWQQLSTERRAADAVVAGIDVTRGEVQGVLSLLD
jgi:O-succinylbenzoate synthase